jgi:hypothetical protein
LETHLSDPDSLAGRIHAGYRELLKARRSQAAFHPDAALRLLDAGDHRVLAIERSTQDGGERILVLVNFGGETTINLAELETGHATRFCNLLAESSEKLPFGPLSLAAGSCVWLKAD